MAMRRIARDTSDAALTPGPSRNAMPVPAMISKMAAAAYSPQVTRNRLGEPPKSAHAAVGAERTTFNSAGRAKTRPKAHGCSAGRASFKSVGRKKRVVLVRAALTMYW